MARNLRPVFALFAVLLAFPAAAQEQEREPDPDTIIITGRGERVPIAAIQRQARDIAVRQGSVFDTPLARFEDRLCPGVAGLTDDAAALIIDRIRANARMLGIRVQDDGCEANFLLFFTADGAGLMRRLMEERPDWFQYLNSGQKDDILAPGPVHVWTSVEPRTLTGMPIAQVRDLTRPPVARAHASHSLIYTSTRRDITSVIMTFDTDDVAQLNVGQLADYATMRGLAQTRAAGGMEVDSILALFAGDDAAPQRLSEFDIAFLRSLYAGHANFPAINKLNDVGDQLRRLAEEGAATE